MMLSPWFLALVALAFGGLLFFIAWWGDRTAVAGRGVMPPAWVYSLALAVHCTSWAYYGTVGQSASLGWSVPPTYIGIILLYLLAPALLAKLVQVSRRERISSVADFVAARYGRDRTIAVAVTLIATCGVVPYIALQLKAIDISFQALAATSGAPAGQGETAAWAAAALALFAILFGARQVDATQHRPGMMLALAFGSVFKLVAFVAVGAYVTFGLFDGFTDLAARTAAIESLAGARAALSSSSHYTALAVLGFFAILCLPWQFHVGVVESNGPADLRLARWVFPAYLLAISVFILPIANAGLVLGAGAADLYVLGLPLGAGAHGLALFAFLGGLAASAGMVIAGSIALATMLCNEVAVPLMMRASARLRSSSDLTQVLLAVRRSAIVLLLAMAWLYHRWIAQSDALASIGEIALAAVALFGPAIIAGLYSRRVNRAGARASLAFGFAVWGWTLLVPTLAQAGLLPAALVQLGPAGIGLLRPTALLGLDGLGTLAHGLGWSLAAACAGLFLGSRATPRSLVERIQAAAFVDAEAGAAARAFDRRRESLTVRELKVLAERFVGARTAARHFAELTPQQDENARASGEQLQATQRLLASAVGASSAQRLLDAAVAGRELPIEDVAQLVGGASQALEFSKELLESTIENVSQGISVVDAGQRVVAWNRRYLEMYGYPPGFVRVGRPVQDLLHFNAERGELGFGDPEELVDRRLEHLRRGTPYVFQRVRRDGTVLEIRGNPMPGGGFVTSYTDVTEYKRNEEALQEANELLERRVRERTQALSVMNEELRAAKGEAERANLSKTRFLAAAGHDLLQPLNAAGLFAGALAQKLAGAEQRSLLADLEGCLNGAESLLSDLLDISKLDAGVIRKDVADCPLGELFAELDKEFRMQARARGLEMHIHDTCCAALTDRKLLKRVLQNYLSNALRYTSRGRVILGVRRCERGLRIEVWDTGAGIPESQQARVFEEFFRGGARRPGQEGEGFGLGLAIVERIARVLGHRIGLRSSPDRGSVFWIELPRGAARPAQAAPVADPGPGDSLAGVRVLCIDNDPAALKALSSLLGAWGCEVWASAGIEELVAGDGLAGFRPDLLIVDFHLDGGATGLDVLRHLRSVEGVAAPALMVSADASEQVRSEADAADCVFLRKPLKPLQLRSALRRLLETQAAGGAGTKTAAQAPARPS
jgi:PAS domain S-box-containing protein